MKSLRFTRSRLRKQTIDARRRQTATKKGVGVNSGALSPFWRRRHTLLLRVLSLLLFPCFWGCKKVPEGRDAVAAVAIEGLPPDFEEHLEERLATKPTPSFFGIKRVYDYETLDEVALERDLTRIERELRRRGYYEAKVSAARILRIKENQVRVEVQIDPGPPIKILTLETTGLAHLSFEVAEATNQEMKLRLGNIFDEDQFEEAKHDMASSLANRGYAFAKVSGSAKVDLAAHTAAVTLRATPGKRSTLGEVTIEGLDKLEESPIRRILQLKSGSTYSQKELQAARSALFQLGVFSRVEVVPNLENPENDVVPIKIRVEESALRDITVGAGVRVDLLRLAAVGQIGWTHRNFLGGLRKFSISTRPGLTFYPTSVDYIQPPTAVFPENFLSLRLEQPGFVEGRTRGFTEMGYNVYPLLYPIAEGEDADGVQVDPRDERVIGYNEVTSSLGAERPFLGRFLFAQASLNWQANLPFAYQGSISEVQGLETVMVAYPELVTNLDFRDDPLQPTKGLYLTNSLQVAVPTLGSDLFDVRIHPEIRTFLPLDRKHRLILATRFGLGMVFPQNYGDALLNQDRVADFTDENVVRDQHKLLFRAFYSGGSNSNRGYPNQRIGPQGPIGFLIPQGEDCVDNPNDATDQAPPTCVRPLGGFSLWEASIELRYRLAENWSLIGFMDSSDVSAKRASFSLAEPHVAAGPGLRYLSPVGPVRIDVGYRLPGLQKLRAIPDEPPDISEVAPYYDPSKAGAGANPWDNQNWKQRFTLHLLIGEAF